MCKFLLTSTRIKLGVFFLAVILARHAKSWGQKTAAKKITRKWDMEFRAQWCFFCEVFFYVHVFCGMPFNAKQTAYWKSLKFVPSCFFNFWSTSNHKWRRQQQWHLTKDFICTLAFIFFAHLSAFLRKKIRECDNQKFKVLRTQTFNRITSNSKRARTKFKLMGKFKMLRKLKQQRAFPARSLHLFAFVCKQQEKY